MPKMKNASKFLAFKLSIHALGKDYNTYVHLL